MTFKIQIEPEAYQDIQDGIDWNNKQLAGLGRRFHIEVRNAFKTLSLNPFFQVRYDKVRCLPLQKFPYMIHFTIDEQNQIVVIRAVFNTSRDPKIWKNR